jgi:hypothetical protein
MSWLIGSPILEQLRGQPHFDSSWGGGSLPSVHWELIVTAQHHLMHIHRIFETALPARVNVMLPPSSKCSLLPWLSQRRVGIYKDLMSKLCGGGDWKNGQGPRETGGYIDPSFKDAGKQAIKYPPADF